MNNLYRQLANHRGFVVYRTTKLPNGKLDKIPVDPITGYNSDAQNPSTWMLPDVALACAASFGAGYGVGLVVYEGSGLFCIDIDHCIEAGVVSDHAKAVLARFPGAFTEVSVSGTGLHIFGLHTGVMPPHKSKNTAWRTELYTQRRFIALSGTDAQGALIDCTAALHAFAAEYFPRTAGGRADEWTDGPAEGWNFLTDDDALVNWLLTFKNPAQKFGGKCPFDALWTANAEVLGQFFPPNDPTKELYDQSSADQSMANHLAWATGNDCQRVLNLMRRSGLAREKWDNRPDWLEGTIMGACGEPKQWPTNRALPAPTPPSTVGPVPGEAPQQPQVVGVPAPGIGPPPDGIPAPPGPVDYSAPHVPARGAIYFTADQQHHFAGLTYVEDVHQIMLENGDLVDQKRFDTREPFAGREFQMTIDGKNPTDSAWKAFTLGMLNNRKVRGQYFEPREAPGAILLREGRTYVNSWQPIEIDATPGDVQWFIDHLNKLLPPATHGNDAHILLQFLKFIVQHKGEKAAWFPFIQGVEGNGKSFINDTVQYCVGERYTHTPRANELAGRFNSAFYGKLFIRIEDIQLGDAHHIWETLKPMVDGKKLEIEYKGVDKVTREVCFNIIATSNHRNGIPVTANDRRVAPFFCAQQFEADLVRDGLTSEYFTGPNGLWAKAKNGGWAAVLHYLSTDPIDPKYNPAVDAARAPETSSRFTAKSYSVGGVEQEIIERVETGLDGFAGGWISSAALDRMLQASGMAKAITQNKRRDMLATLGYVPHPALLDGRVGSPLPDGTKPRLYVKRDHSSIGLTDKALVRQMYINAQQAPKV